MGLKPVASSGSVAPPAVQRIEAHTKIYGNWWNHLVNTTHYNGPLPTRGLRLEWWEIDDHSPLRPPSEPVLLTAGHLGLPLSDERSYGPVDDRMLPFIASMEYDPTGATWYEIVIFNYEGQNHPYHLHGFHACITGYNYTEIPLQQNPSFDKETGQLVYKPELYGIPGLGEDAPCTMADSFTIPYFGFVVMRVRSDNPGIWLFHCHMDYHLAAGMGFFLDVKRSGGGDDPYGLGPPPDGMPMCGKGGSWAGNKGNGGGGQQEADVPSTATALGSDGGQGQAAAGQSGGRGGSLLREAAGWAGRHGGGDGWLQSASLVLAGTLLGYALSLLSAWRGRRGDPSFRPMEYK